VHSVRKPLVASVGITGGRRARPPSAIVGIISEKKQAPGAAVCAPPPNIGLLYAVKPEP